MKKIIPSAITTILLVITFTTSCAQRVMVFGCFDLLHEGHIQFLQQARYHGSVIAVVTRDSLMQLLKQRPAYQSQDVRLKQVQQSHLVFQAILSDETLGTYEVIHTYKPDLICLGYDQQALEKDLQARMQKGQLPAIAMIFLKPYQETIYHTSLLNNTIK